MSQQLRDQMRSDDGFSMILVLGIGVMLTAFAFLAAAGSITAIQDSGRHVVYAQNLDVAEAGIDQITARLQQTNGSYSYCPVTTNVPECNVSTSVQTTGFPSKAAERDWARTTLTRLASDQPSLLTKVSGGQFLAIRPSGLQTVYSMSWVPSFSSATRQRLLKSEYIFSTYQSTNAILTNGDIDCCFSYDVGLAPNMPAGSPLMIHTNGTLGGVPGVDSGSAPSIQASASGSCNSPCTSAAPTQTVPIIDPLAIYGTEATRYQANWYDLCPDGHIHSPKPIPGSDPCTGALAPGFTSLPFRGWSRSGNSGSYVWTYSGGNHPGVYYVHRGSISLDSVTVSGGMTLITESTKNRQCSKAGADGWQEYKKVDWVNGGFIPGLLVVSGNYWYQSSQSRMGTGAILAQGYVEQQTSSAPGVTGQLIAENLCGETNRLQGSVLHFSGSIDLPISPLVRSTLELELN